MHLIKSKPTWRDKGVLTTPPCPPITTSIIKKFVSLNTQL